MSSIILLSPFYRWQGSLCQTLSQVFFAWIISMNLSVTWSGRTEFTCIWEGRAVQSGSANHQGICFPTSLLPWVFTFSVSPLLWLLCLNNENTWHPVETEFQINHKQKLSRLLWWLSVSLISHHPEMLWFCSSCLKQCCTGQNQGQRQVTGEAPVEALCLSHQSWNQYPAHKLRQLLTLESDTVIGNWSLQLLKPQSKPPSFTSLWQGSSLVSLAPVWMLVGSHIPNQFQKTFLFMQSSAIKHPGRHQHLPVFTLVVDWRRQLEQRSECGKRISSAGRTKRSLGLSLPDLSEEGQVKGRRGRGCFLFSFPLPNCPHSDLALALSLTLSLFLTLSPPLLLPCLGKTEVAEVEVAAWALDLCPGVCG